MKKKTYQEAERLESWKVTRSERIFILLLITNYKSLVTIRPWYPISTYSKILGKACSTKNSGGSDSEGFDKIGHGVFEREIIRRKLWKRKKRLLIRL